MNITELFLRFSVGYGAEWVMWLLIGLSGVSMHLMIERAIFFFRSRTDVASPSVDELRRARFTPARDREGRPVATRIVYTVRYVLEA